MYELKEIPVPCWVDFRAPSDSFLERADELRVPYLHGVTSNVGDETPFVRMLIESQRDYAELRELHLKETDHE